VVRDQEWQLQVVRDSGNTGSRRGAVDIVAGEAIGEEAAGNADAWRAWRAWSAVSGVVDSEAIVAVGTRRWPLVGGNR
jgi:hypothetical protein